MERRIEGRPCIAAALDGSRGRAGDDGTAGRNGRNRIEVRRLEYGVFGAQLGRGKEMIVDSTGRLSRASRTPEAPPLRMTDSVHASKTSAVRYRASPPRTAFTTPIPATAITPSLLPRSFFDFAHAFSRRRGRHRCALHRHQASPPAGPNKLFRNHEPLTFPQIKPQEHPQFRTVVSGLGHSRTLSTGTLESVLFDGYTLESPLVHSRRYTLETPLLHSRRYTLDVYTLEPPLLHSRASSPTLPSLLSSTPEPPFLHSRTSSRAVASMRYTSAPLHK